MKIFFELLTVFIVSILIGSFIAYSWENQSLERIADFLFSFFLPSIISSIFVAGGKEGAGSTAIIVGVVIQCFSIFYLLKFFYIKIKTSRSSLNKSG